MTRTLLDTGPLVAFLNRNDQWHAWAKAQMGALPPPLLTCEPVLTEACFLIQRHGGQPAEVLKQVQASLIEVALEIETEAAALETRFPAARKPSDESLGCVLSPSGLPNPSGTASSFALGLRKTA